MDYLLRGILIGLLFGSPVAAVGVFGVTLVCGVFIGTYIWWGAFTAVTNIIKENYYE